MAKPHLQEERSSYYPPRQRWYSPVFELGDTLCRLPLLDRFQKPADVTFGGAVASFLVPGLGFWLRGPKIWGRAALVGSALLIFIFIVWLGCPVANLAFGLLLSIHSSGFVFYCRSLIADERFLGRLAISFVTMVAVGGLIYLPARNFIQGRWLTPLRMDGRVVVVRRSLETRSIRRGDWVAYNMGSAQAAGPHAGHAVRVETGVGLAPVLATAGDRIAFAPDSYSVNGTSFLRLEHMPLSGELNVPENHWFIWPKFGIRGHGMVGEAAIAGAMLNLASVDETQFIGKAFHRWFWRKQTLP